jgi:hypothetical protein
MTERAHEQVPVALRRLAASVVAPEALTADGLRQRFGDPQGVEVAVGQLWRACWGDVAVLALLVDAQPAAVMIVPVTVDPPGEDENSLTLDAKSTVLGQPATAWAGLSREFPLRVLDQLLDVVADEIVVWCQRIQAGRPAAVPAGARLGERISSPLEPAAEVRAQLEDELDLLAAASWLPVMDPAVERRDLRQLLGCDRDEEALRLLVATLGVSLPEAVEIVRGRRPLALAQADALAPVTGQPVEVLLASVEPLPEELVAELDHPRWRPAVRRRAHRASRNETHARLEIAYGAYAFAARQTGAATTPSWRERLARYLEAEGDQKEPGL